MATESSETCEHINFESGVTVMRLTDEVDGETRVVGFTVEMRVRCKDCELPFEWVGVPFGSSPAHPTTSIDGSELRAPIIPQRLSERRRG